MERDKEDQDSPTDSPAHMSTLEKATAFSSAAVTGLGSYVTSGSMIVTSVAGVLALILLAVVLGVSGR